ncbi:uncharacterized protein LOC118740223 [Rhagoletis pomonella]|uniref:uncharacterized protein LOC118740223 n=1 Tax=Rhagoletis pomonella TaxID=28610 RepID=UPI001785D9BA|nr:uncharacterized protein LOC118740223 [Rhagoletis pomonella]
MYLTEYEWYYMPSSVHKILMHGYGVIEYFDLPIGNFSEEALEALHKHIRIVRYDHTQHTCNDFTCAAREFCISPDLLCDGINHCGDNSDESVCQSETAATVFGVDMTWFVLIVVGIVLVLSAVIVGISICVCRRQDEANLNQNTAIQMHHTAETNGSSKHLHYHHGGTLSREHTQLPPTSGNWHHPAGPYGYHSILRNLSKMATKVRPIWCLANSVN